MQEVSSPGDDIDRIWNDLKQKDTEEERNKQEIKRMREETREMRRQMQEETDISGYQEMEGTKSTRKIIRQGRSLGE